MKHFLLVKLPDGTYTTAREESHTETPKPRQRAEQPVQAQDRAQGIPSFLVDTGRRVSGATWRDSVSCENEGSVVLALPDPENAILNAPDADLSEHVRRAQWSIGEYRLPLGSTHAEQRFSRFRSRLAAMLLDEPIEDGVTHPAEHLIDEALRTASSDCLDWLSQVLVEQYQTRPSISASIVRCIGRLEYDQIGAWGMRVADDALRHKDVEVREAAIRALEAWGGRKALDILRNHDDERPWLNEYVRQVIVDLSGTAS